MYNSYNTSFYSFLNCQKCVSSKLSYLPVFPSRHRLITLYQSRSPFDAATPTEHPPLTTSMILPLVAVSSSPCLCLLQIWEQMLRKKHQQTLEISVDAVDAVDAVDVIATYYRVVHSWHFWSIFHSFSIHFPFHFVSIFSQN